MDTAVFVVVVALRLLVPLAIPRYPLPAILAALVVDGVDQTVFQTFGGEPPDYQSSTSPSSTSGTRSRPTPR